MNKQLLAVGLVLLCGISILPLTGDNARAADWITVTYPIGGTFYRGETIAITWTSSFVGGYVEIELYRGGDYYSTITSHTSNDGRYDWYIPTNLPSTSYYQIKITSKSDPDVYADSYQFYFYEQSITITSPSSGTTWYTGRDYYITWSYHNAGSYVSIGLYKDGDFQHTITSIASNDGEYFWQRIGGLTTSSKYQIKITSSSYYWVYDYSEYFTIKPRTMTVTAPVGHDTWYKGKTYNITWDAVLECSEVSIYLYSRWNHYLTINSSTENDGTYSWTIPTTMSSGTYYQMRISSGWDFDLYDLTDYFNISDEPINISAPSHNDTWYKGATYNITWEGGDTGNWVKIELCNRDSFTCPSSQYVSTPIITIGSIYWSSDEWYYQLYRYTIASSVANDGQYEWTVPVELSSMEDYLIRISDTSDSSVYGYSGNFTITEPMRITAPKRNERLQRGETYFITWDSAIPDEYVTIELYMDEYPYMTIAENTSNDGNYSWIIPTSLSPDSTYQIKIASALDNNYYAFTEGYLTINEPFQQTAFNIMLLVFLIAVIALVVIYLILRKRKHPSVKPETEAATKETVKEPKVKLEAAKVSDEEYERIWEKR